MASEKWSTSIIMKKKLAENFYQFNFFKAVQLLESMYPEKEKLGKTLSPLLESVRFMVSPDIQFPPADILNIDFGYEDEPVKMEVPFMGLIGISGVLPDWYNELALEMDYVYQEINDKDGDSGMTAFYNIFHHRLISLFYLAWKKTRIIENYSNKNDDKVSRILLSLLGLGTDNILDNIKLKPEMLINYSGLLSRQVPSAYTIEKLIEYAFQQKVKVVQFIDRLISVLPEDQTQIGKKDISFKDNILCGSFFHDCQSCFRVEIGPLEYEPFIDFLPGKDNLRKLFTLIRYIVGVEYEFQVRIILKKKYVSELKFSNQVQLGWTTWLGKIRKNQYVTFNCEEII